MSSETKDNIRNKRRIRRRYRLLQFIRLVFYLVILAVIGWGLLQVFRVGADIYGKYYAMYQDYTERREQRRTKQDEQYDGYLNLLLLGIDDGPGGQKPAADTVLLLSLDRASGRIRLLSIPRGTLVTTENGPHRLVEVYQQGGAPAMLRAAQGLLGVSVHHYAAVGTAALAQFIDALGGVEVYVERQMDYEDPEAGLAIHIPQGYQRLDGETALKFLRYRSGEFGDLGRVQRQQRFLKAVYSRLRQPEVLTKLPQIVPILQEQVDTSFEVWDSTQLTSLLRSFPEEGPETVILPGQPIPGNDTYYVPDMEKIKEKMWLFFPPPEEAAAESAK